MLGKKYKLLLITILVLATIIRLRGFDSRFLLSSDTARDILVAKGAVMLNQLPWVGSFSSAGPFVFGPNWYWLLMLPVIIAPTFFYGPWLVMLAMSLAFVLLVFFIGKEFGGKRLGLIAALITAFSPAAIALAVYPTQHAMIEITSAIALLGFISYLKTQKWHFIFLMGLGIGSAISFHYQAINLLIYFPLVLVFELLRRHKVLQMVKNGLVAVFGLIVPLLPLFIWDQSMGFSNTRRVVEFFLVGQQNFPIVSRWLTYVNNFWPTFIGKLVGGNYIMGAALCLLCGLTIIVAVFKKKLRTFFIFPLIAFFVQFVIMRYFKGERYDGYLVYFHPIILLLVAWSINQLVLINKLVGSLFIIIAVICGVCSAMPTLDWHNDVDKLVTVKELVNKRFGNQKITLYTRGQSTFNIGYSLSFILNDDFDNGVAVGVCKYECSVKDSLSIAKNVYQNDPFEVVDLSNVDKSLLTKQNDWYQTSTLAVYDDVQNWWRKGIKQ